VLTVRHTEPEKAALIANGLINVLIDENEQLQAIRYISAEQNLQNRIDETQQQISLLENKLNELSTATVESQLESVQKQILETQSQMTALNVEVAKINPATASMRKSQISRISGSARSTVIRSLPISTDLY